MQHFLRRRERVLGQQEHKARVEILVSGIRVGDALDELVERGEVDLLGLVILVLFEDNVFRCVLQNMMKQGSVAQRA